MSDIELVIKIDEEYIKQIDKLKFLIGGREDRRLQINVINAIKNGTPLPKGHGDLKDMDDVYEALEGWDDDTGWIVDAIDCQAPTIIEADKAESEVEE